MTALIPCFLAPVQTPVGHARPGAAGGPAVPVDRAFIARRGLSMAAVATCFAAGRRP